MLRKLFGPNWRPRDEKELERQLNNLERRKNYQTIKIKT
jgi:hypothetical protein